MRTPRPHGPPTRLTPQQRDAWAVPATDPADLAAMVAAAAHPGLDSLDAADAVRLLARTQPALSAADLHRLAAQVDPHDFPQRLAGAAAALLDHPAADDSVAVAVLGLPWNIAGLRPALGWVPYPGSYLHGLGGAVAALRDRHHPVAAALALATLDAGLGPQVTPALVLAEAGRVRAAADRDRLDPGRLTDLVLALAPGFPGTPAQLLASAAGVLSGSH